MRDFEKRESLGEIQEQSFASRALKSDALARTLEADTKELRKLLTSKDRKVRKAREPRIRSLMWEIINNYVRLSAHIYLQERPPLMEHPSNEKWYE